MDYKVAGSQAYRLLGAAVVMISLLASASADPGLSAEELARERAALLAIMAKDQAPAVDAAEQIPLPEAAGLGAEDARLVILEFGDYQCGFCRRHVTDVMPALLREHVDPGHLRYLFMEYPAQRRLPASLEASNAALCADDQGRYWEMRQEIYANPMSLDEAGYRHHAASMGLDMEVFNRCLEEVPHAARIERHVALGRELRVRGTPTFFVAVQGTGEDDLRLVRRITGAQPFDLFEQELRSLSLE
jgi:protein-disulfide isomerase